MITKTRTATLGMALGAISLALSPHTDADAKELTYSTFLPPQHVVNARALPPFLEDIKKATNGSLTIKLVPGAQLFDAKSSISSTGDGLADVTNGLSAYTPNQLPNFNILFEMVGFVADPQVGGGAALQTVLLDCKECRDDFKKLGTTFLTSYPTSNAGIFCSKPVSTLADLKGVKMRVSGAGGRLANAMGATPVRVSTADLVSSVQRGNIDCILGPLAWIRSYNLYESLKSVINYPFGSFPNAILTAFNTKTWEKLTSDERKAVVRLMPSLSARVTHLYLKDHDSTLGKVKARGIPVSAGGQEFSDLMQRHQAKEVGVISKNAAKFKVQNAGGIIATFQKNLKRWTALVAGTDGSEAAYAKLLWDEVYSKIDPDKI